MVMKFIGSALIIWGLKQQENNMLKNAGNIIVPEGNRLPLHYFVHTNPATICVDLVANIAMTTVEKETLIERIK